MVIIVAPSIRDRFALCGEPLFELLAIGALRWRATRRKWREGIALFAALMALLIADLDYNLAVGNLQRYPWNYVGDVAYSLYFLGLQRVLARQVFLLDYELIGFERTGLDLIEQYNLHERSFLVTSRAQDPTIISRAERASVRIIPKSVAPSLPIRCIAPKDDGISSLILIDDDGFARDAWIAVAAL